MIRSFRNQGTEDLFHGRDTKAARKVCPREAWSAARRKLGQLEAAKELKDVGQLPGNRLEKHVGRAFVWSVRVNDRYRLCFNWTDAAEDVEILDYH